VGNFRTDVHGLIVVRQTQEGSLDGLRKQRTQGERKRKKWPENVCRRQGECSAYSSQSNIRRVVQMPVWKRRLELAASGYCIMGFYEHELSVWETGTLIDQ
jgi:hypothetical protein